jgi:rod shape determining protein RodA
MGILSIYSSTSQKEGELWQIIYKRQIFWIILGVLFFLAMSRFNYRRLWDMTYFLYGLALFLLFLVVILGLVRLGAQRWIRIAWLNFQPSELAKIAGVIFLARYFSAKSASSIHHTAAKYGIFRAFILPSFFIALPVGLIIEQPDLGTGLIILFIFVAFMYIGGVRSKYLITISLIGVLLLPVFWHVLRDYQKDRLMAFLNPHIDPLGAGYTVIQSKIAIGSGGLFGKGWLAGTQSQLHFLPESHTDFIFATFAEEWGFLGALFLLFLYFILIRQGIKIALATGDYFGRLLAFGISLMLGIQIFVNIAMNLGLAPVVGVPLPLMSYGGSSIMITFISLGILANIARNRTTF